MLCRISDGPQTPEDYYDLWDNKLEDEDAAYDEQRQIEIDAETFANGAEKQ